jgi:hypothetical protein
MFWELNVPEKKSRSNGTGLNQMTHNYHYAFQQIFSNKVTFNTAFMPIEI